MDFITELQTKFFEYRGHYIVIGLIVLLLVVSTWVSIGD